MSTLPVCEGVWVVKNQGFYCEGSFSTITTAQLADGLVSSGIVDYSNLGTAFGVGFTVVTVAMIVGIKIRLLLRAIRWF